MAKKSKKPTEIQNESIEIIKEYFNNYVISNPDAYSVEFQENNTKSDIHFDCIISYKGFDAVVKYNGAMLLQENNIDVKFKYDKSEYYFSVYDIFNALDINDFNCYYYQNCLGRDMIINALDSITFLISKYYYKEIQMAGDDTHLPSLVKLFESDQLTANGDNWKEEINDLDGFDLTHIFFLTTTAKTKEKLIKRLEKYDAKGKLITYEKRLLAYLKAGNEMVKTADVSDEYDKIITKIKIKVYSSVFIVTVIVFSIINLVALNFYFGKGYVPTEDFKYFGTSDFKFYIPTMFILLIVSLVFMSGFFVRVLGNKIVYKLCPDNVKNYFSTDEKKELGNKKLEKISNKYIAPIVLLVISVFVLSLANVGISFTDNGIRSHQLPFSVVEKSYDEIEIYQCKQYYDDDEEKYIDYQGICYAIGWDGDYFLMTECDDLSETDKVIKDIADKYQKNIIQVENEDVLADLCYE